MLPAGCHSFRLRLAALLLAVFGLIHSSSRSTSAFEPGANLSNLASVSFPPCENVVDVTRPPYNAKGDGVTDDTDALQRALSDIMGQHKMLYLPAGTYLVSRSLKWSKQNSQGREAWGKNYIQGEHVDRTIIRLKDGTFRSANDPQAIMWCGGFGSADWFHNYVQDLTFDVGRDNPGAIGLQFYSNNSGAVRNCRILAAAGSGVIGLDLGHRDMNGPLLVRNCEIVGFQQGIKAAGGVNSQTFERITLRGQGFAGLENAGQALSIRGLLSENAVPAIRAYGVVCLVDSRLSGTPGADRFPAIINYNGGRIYLRSVATSGYLRAVADLVTPDWVQALQITGEHKPGTLGPNIDEYCSHSVTSPFGDPLRSLRLPVFDPPEIHLDEPHTWANVDDFGADPTGKADSAAAIQSAIDSGASTIFFPGSYALKSPVTIRGKARRLVGIGGMIDYTSQSRPDFRIVDGESPVVSLEHFAYVHGGLEIDTQRTVVLRSVADCDLTSTSRAEGSRLFLEDVVTHNMVLRGQQVWARQLNVENEGTHITNDGGVLWVLGYKTERGGTLLQTRGGGRSELLGGFSYTTTAGSLAPMFVSRDSDVFAFFHEVCYNGDPFRVLIDETRGGESRRVQRGEGLTAPYVSHGRSGASSSGP